MPFLHVMANSWRTFNEVSLYRGAYIAFGTVTGVKLM